MPSFEQIRDYHRRHPAARVVDATEDYEELLKEEPHIEFSGEVVTYLHCSGCFNLNVLFILLIDALRFEMFLHLLLSVNFCSATRFFTSHFRVPIWTCEICLISSS